MRATVILLSLVTVVVSAPQAAFPFLQGANRIQNSAPPPALPQGEKGMELLKRGQYAEATAELRQAIKLDPGSFKYSLALGEALLASNHNFTGLDFLLKVRPRFQSRQEYRYMLALAYYVCYQYPAAISEFKTLPGDNPKLNRIPFLIGNCYMAMGHLKQAEISFRQAIKLKPDETAYYVSLAKMLRMEGPQNLNQAISVLNEALKLKPRDVDARLHLAYCEEGKGNYAKAQALLEQVVTDRPDFQPARLALASVYEHDHEWLKARQQREIAARLKPPAPLRNPDLGPVASNLAAP